LKQEKKVFSEVVREETNIRQPYRLVVIAERRMVRRPKQKRNEPARPLSTSAKLYNIAKRKGIDVYSCKVNGAYVKRDGRGKLRIHNHDDERGFVLDGDTVIMIRGAMTYKDSYLDLISQLERLGFPVVNSRECIEVCSDKYRT